MCERRKTPRARSTGAKSQADREGRDLTASEMTTINTAMEKYRALEKRVGAASSDAAMRTAIARIETSLMPENRALMGSSLGAQFARANGEWLRDPRNRGTWWETPMLELDDPRFGGERHATTLTGQAGSGGALVLPQSTDETATGTTADRSARSARLHAGECAIALATVRRVVSTRPTRAHLGAGTDSAGARPRSTRRRQRGVKRGGGS